MQGVVTKRGKWNMGLEPGRGRLYLQEGGGTGVIHQRLGHKKWSNSRSGVEQPKSDVI